MTDRPLALLLNEETGAPVKLDVAVRESTQLSSRLKVGFQIPAGTPVRPILVADGYTTANDTTAKSDNPEFVAAEIRLEMN